MWSSSSEPSWFKALATLSKNSSLSVIPGVAFCKCGMQTCFVQADVSVLDMPIAEAGCTTWHHLFDGPTSTGKDAWWRESATHFQARPWIFQISKSVKMLAHADWRPGNSANSQPDQYFLDFFRTFSFWMFSSPQSSMLKKYPTFVAWCFHPCLCAWNLKHPFEPRQKPGLTFHEILVV